MALELIDIVKNDGVDVHIHPTSITLEEGSFNVLLGTTLAGKTTLMQIIAGIQRPSSGTIRFRGKDVTGQAVQKRNVSMVYQQFINYPNLSVYDNIASPLKVARMDRAEIDRRVMAAAELLRLKPMLNRKPSELSGGQQQRTAMARAIVKDSDLILLDEPLANLDYKLREELRDELPRLFADRKAIVVYATTEPSEALLFGGNTATLHEGRITQFGLTSSIYRRPQDLITAQVFSDPPINLAKVEKRGNKLLIFDNQEWPVAGAAEQLADGPYILGIRPHHVSPQSSSDFTAAIQGKVMVTEISGSESVIHITTGENVWVSLAHGIHELEIASPAILHADLSRAMFFSPSGRLVS